MHKQNFTRGNAWSNGLGVQYSPDVAELVANIEQNTRRYQNLFCEAADDLMRDLTLFPPSDMAAVPKDVFDVMLAQVRSLTFVTAFPIHFYTIRITLYVFQALVHPPASNVPLLVTEYNLNKLWNVWPCIGNSCERIGKDL